MQTIYLDITNRGVVPVVYAKQMDVGRKIEVILTNSGLPYTPDAGTTFSAWYSGSSGEGNYTHIGDRYAFSTSGNKVVVELITQMLSNPGGGNLCLVMSGAGGDQLGSWNIPYICEGIPGAGSKAAEQYYTAFSKAVETLAYPDASLSIPGKAADAAATGAHVNDKNNPHGVTIAQIGAAPAGYGLGDVAQRIDSWNNAKRNGFYVSSYGCPDGDGNEWHGIVCNYNTALCNQLLWKSWTTGSVMASRRIIDGVVEPWEWVNPPMVLGVEYRTTERWNGKSVYTKLIDFGALPNASEKIVSHATGATEVIRVSGWTNHGWTIPYERSDGREIRISATSTAIIIVTGTDVSEQYASVQIWYTKG